MTDWEQVRRIEKLEAELSAIRVSQIPTRQHSDEAWRQKVAALEARVAELESDLAASGWKLRALEASKADTKRLDWLQKNAASSEPMAVWTTCWEWRYMGVIYPTLRAAIDAAIKDTQGGVGK